LLLPVRYRAGPGAGSGTPGGFARPAGAARQTSPLYDTDLFRKSIETAYLRMEISAEGLAPQSFTVPG
jgi:hypothetical protein